MKALRAERMHAASAIQVRCRRPSKRPSLYSTASSLDIANSQARSLRWVKQELTLCLTQAAVRRWLHGRSAIDIAAPQSLHHRRHMTSAFDISPEAAASGNNREATASGIGEPLGAHTAADVEQDGLTQVQLQNRHESHADLDLHELQLLLRTHEEWGAQIASAGSMPGV